VDEELTKELRHHLEEQAAEYASSGMNDEQARAAARRLFGSVALIGEQCRDQRRTSWIEDFLNDARFARRGFLKSPAFALVAILTLALGIGANTAIFSMAYAVLFRPLPYPQPERLLVLETGLPGVGPVTSLRDLSKYVDYAGYDPNLEVSLQHAGEASRIRGAVVTSNLSRVLGVAPARGRWFSESEEQAGQHRVAVLSHRMWRERFGEDPDVLGRRILLNEDPFEIVGVMPERFAFPSPDTEFWVPVRIDPRNVGYMWGGSNLHPIGRLHPDASFRAARAELPATVNRIRGMFPWRMPDDWARSSTPVQYSESITRSVSPKTLALSAAASCW
jgi:hypothetical protein